MGRISRYDAENSEVFDIRDRWYHCFNITILTEVVFSEV